MWAFPFHTQSITTNQSWLFPRNRERQSLRILLYAVLQAVPCCQEWEGDEAASIPASAVRPRQGLGEVGEIEEQYGTT